MTEESKDGFVEKLKSLQSFGDFFELQKDLKQEIESNGVTAVIEKVIKVVGNAEQEIPYIREVLEGVFEYPKVRNTDRELDQFEKYIHRKYPQFVRKVAIQISSKYRPERIVRVLVDISRDQTDGEEIRLEALQALMKAIPQTPDLFALSEVLEQDDEKLVLAAMDVFEHHREQAPFEETQVILERFLPSSTSLNLRCRAIELLGLFGEIDMIERVCMLPAEEPEVQKAIQKMVQRITSKPRNLLYLRPEHFEVLIKEWLIRLQYEQVEVTQPTMDEGIDVIACKKGSGVTKGKKYKVVVQCKRYRTNKVDVEVLERLINDVKIHRAKEGQLITTSSFSERAKKLAKEHLYIVLIDREELQKQLDEVFGKDHYCIIVRD